MALRYYVFDAQTPLGPFALPVGIALGFVGTFLVLGLWLILADGYLRRAG